MIGSLRLGDLVEEFGGTLIGSSVEFDAICTDTRKQKPGALFVALSGENFDGNRFAQAAQLNGAVAVVVSASQDELTVPQWVVDDPLVALGQMASVIRRRFRGPVIAVTGSAGKTTLRAMCEGILSVEGNTHATRGNFNNEVGVPKTLFELTDEHRFAVVEMGAGKLGDIAYLCSIATPDVTVVNNVLPAHIEGFGSLDGVAETKGAIYDLGPRGVKILDVESPYYAYWSKKYPEGEVIRIADNEESSADIWSSAVTENHYGQPSFLLHTPQGIAEVQLQVIGRHNVHNAVVAAALCSAVGASLDAIETGLGSVIAVDGRMSVKYTAAGARLIDDSYNANPGSMRSALDALATQKGKRIFVMGNMAELGPDSDEMHRDIGRYCSADRVDLLVTVGSSARLAATSSPVSTKSFDTHLEATEFLRNFDHDQSVMLVKGSRSARMDQIISNLLSKD
ncbi:UDP-N-acetylmuramoyl-tripeptide--D-alanyl-D-alanine ligase [Umboniibacter marinipuniceus]|uniref:UDP-N-acetylmuramoyl-tripeptide--D-alanyl-D-alanine ligase n=1 Tax=Umboniibacter marinipuniceus TaxID=569599 RepID=A0A3M0A8C3_9GAMM|nr:UDP-N-acetylmuramoyl-tripeptide--D-alanyl-D-alanine ligase [Umboniibacter marinipuniceus]RMA81441.1 UDP-N-acetylmuramoyl-tripeptide--D-alanyl-D-alanine ligase [Umboniibacter marinipuniceus]